MEYRRLGHTGLKVSSLCVGTMTWGNRTNEAEAQQIVDVAIGEGVNFFDTANVYGRGVSESILGRRVKRLKSRDKLVLATKFTGGMGKGPNEQGSSRAHMLQAVEDSLKRLQTDYIDLYYVHFMDLGTPLEETLQTFNDLVRSGKVRYIGTSKWIPTFLAESALLAQQHGWAKFCAEQCPYNLLDRSVEKELVFTALRHGIGLVPWAPLATGILTGQYQTLAEMPEGSRFEAGGGANRLTQAAIDRALSLLPLAEAKGLTLAQFSLAWLHQQPAVTAPILGCRTVDHLVTGLAGIAQTLTDDELAKVDAIAPPGSAVSDYWDANTFNRLRPTYQPARR